MDTFDPKISDIGEFELLAQIKQQLATSSPHVILGIGDDAAAFSLPEARLGLLSSDLLLQGVHFDLSYTTPYQLGQKALAVNISDIAAMGGVPCYALVSMALPGDCPVAWISEFYNGLKALGEKYETAIIGGDTSASPNIIMISISIWGEVEAELLLSRRGAKPGDQVLVTGNLGEAAAGLALLKANKQSSYPDLVQRQLTPIPRCSEALIIAHGRWASSMIDVSDGLVSDIKQLARESNVGAEIWLDKLPISQAVAEVAGQLGVSAYELAISGGEDYELLFSVPPNKLNHLLQEFTRQQTPLSIIGCIKTMEQGVCFLGENGQKIVPKAGYEHFSPKNSGLVMRKSRFS